MVEPVPEGYAKITPYLVVRDCAAAIEFYKKAFGAEEIFRMLMPDSDRIMHAEIKVNGTPVMMTEEVPEWGSQSPLDLGGTPVSLHLYVSDIDSVYTRAQEAGCEPVMPPQDMFWGDRFGRLKDPYGHSWSIATHVRDVSPEEMAEGAKQAFAKAAGDG